MGYTSTTQPIDTVLSREAIRKCTEVIEASQENMFRRSIKQLRTMFAYCEICDNGKVYLKNNMGDFVGLV